VLGMAVLRNYIPLPAAMTVVVVNGIPEAIVAAIVVVAVVAAWKRIETGSGKSKV